VDAPCPVAKALAHRSVNNTSNAESRGRGRVPRSVATPDAECDERIDDDEPKWKEICLQCYLDKKKSASESG